MIWDAIEAFTSIWFWMGLSSAILAGFAEYMGLALAKYAHVKNYENPIERRKFYLRDMQWWSSFFLYFLGFAFNVIALIVIQMSLVVTLTGLGVFLGVFYTAWYTAERTTNRDYYAIFLSVLGTNRIRGTVTVDTILDAMSPTHVASFTFFMLLLLIGIAFIVLSFFKRFRNSFTATAVPAVWGGMAFVLTKATVELIDTSVIKGNNQFSRWQAVVILILTILSLLLQVRFIQNLLIYYEFTMVSVIYYSIICFTSVSASQLLFSEWESNSPAQTLILFTGLFIQYVGIYMLLTSHSNALSLYPINEAYTGGGPMFQVSNVDLDEDDEMDLKLERGADRPVILTPIDQEL
ncbi:magnesium transporter [Acrasis kona]|uniref:Magnesium transporter n=1 Tax=Acrasis kona TaxID=1008807 RepID=A0AAW2Z603_9EUKA